jgi:hypothetical protein
MFGYELEFWCTVDDSVDLEILNPDLSPFGMTFSVPEVRSVHFNLPLVFIPIATRMDIIRSGVVVMKGLEVFNIERLLLMMPYLVSVPGCNRLETLRVFSQLVGPEFRPLP